MKYILLFLSMCLFVGCAQMRTTQPLPVNTEVTLISSLSPAIRYDYVGPTIFNNTHFDYVSSNAMTSVMLENALMNTLRREKGYRVQTRHISKQTLSDFEAGYGRLSPTEKRAALLSFARNPHTKRVILLSDATLYLYRTYTAHSEGMGYRAMNKIFYTQTDYFGAVWVTIYDVNSPDKVVERRIQLMGHAPASLFASSAHMVTPTSINHVMNWIDRDFSLEVWSELKAAGV